MTETREIPEDVRKLASGILAANGCGAFDRLNLRHPEAAEIIAYAILAERERCARVANEQDDVVLAVEAIRAPSS